MYILHVVLSALNLTFKSLTLNIFYYLACMDSSRNTDTVPVAYLILCTYLHYFCGFVLQIMATPKTMRTTLWIEKLVYE